LQGDIERGGRREFSRFLQARIEKSAVDKLHGEKEYPVLLAEVVDRGNVRMAQTCGSTRLAENRLDLRARCPDSQRDIAPEVHVARFVSHAALVMFELPRRAVGPREHFEMLKLDRHR
jgi:hypothetical protein